MIHLIGTLKIATEINVFVELEGCSSESQPFNPDENVEDVKKSIRETFSLTGGTLQKVSNCTAKFTTVINDKEEISVDYDYSWNLCGGLLAIPTPPERIDEPDYFNCLS